MFLIVRISVVQVDGKGFDFISVVDPASRMPDGGSNVFWETDETMSTAGSKMEQLAAL